MSHIHATNMAAHEKLNTNSETTITAMTKQLVILEKSQKTCQEENFELIEDLQQLDIQYSKSRVLLAIFVPCCVWLGGFLFDSNLGKVIQNRWILTIANHRHSAYWLT